MDRPRVAVIGYGFAGRIAGDIDAAQEDPAHYARLHLTAGGQAVELEGVSGA